MGKTSVSKLSHVDPRGRVRMVDVGDKAITTREAVARGSIRMSAEARRQGRRGAVKKGDPPTARGYDIEARVRTEARTGVEMEALTAVAVAALTIYDMVKAVDKAMVIGDICLLEKRGGKSGEYVRAAGRASRSRAGGNAVGGASR